MKTSRVVGLLVVAGIAIGAFLSAVLPDFGIPGLGSGGGIGNPPPAKPVATVSTVSDGPVESTETPPDEEAPPPSAVIYVMIDGRDYFLRRSPEGKAPFRPATLESVVEAAKAATGDDNGIRVRIAQKSSSRETTERALRAKLAEAGIPADAIRWKDEPVDGQSPTE